MGEQTNELVQFCQQLKDALPQTCEVEHLTADLETRRWHLVLQGLNDLSARRRCESELKQVIGSRWQIVITWLEAEQSPVSSESLANESEEPPWSREEEQTQAISEAEDAALPQQVVPKTAFMAVDDSNMDETGDPMTLEQEPFFEDNALEEEVPWQPVTKIDRTASDASAEFRRKRDEEIRAEVDKVRKEASQAVLHPVSAAANYLGKTIMEVAVPLKKIEESPYLQTIQGQIFALEKQALRNGQTVYKFDLYDGSDSLTVKAFIRDSTNSNYNNNNAYQSSRNKQQSQRMDDLKLGTWVKVSGKAAADRFEDNEVTMSAEAINDTEAPPNKRHDTATAKRVELHAHTNMSSMDALCDVTALVKRAAEFGHQAIAITDHGVLQAYPDAAAAAKKYGIKIIYGCEIYLIDRLEDRKYHHCVVLIKDKAGLKEMYKLTSKAHLENFYKRPRVLRQDLQAVRQHFLIGSACAYGEVYEALIEGFEGDFSRARATAKELARFYDYLEIMPVGHNAFAIQNGQVADENGLRQINRTLWEIGKELEKPVVATSDVHFLDPEDVIFRDILQAGQDYEADESKPLLYFRTTEEMLAEFPDWPAEEVEELVIGNAQMLAAAVESFDPMLHKLYPPKIPGAAEELQRITYETAHAMYGDPLPQNVADRIKWELDCIIGYGYAVNYYIAYRLVKKSMEDGYLVGSRGSVGSSLVATLTGITEVNPLSAHYRCPRCRYSDFSHEKEYDCGADMPDMSCPKCGEPLLKEGFNIRFEVFMGFAGDKIPDIDLNFSGEYQAQAHKYTEELFGKEFVFRAGTISTVAEKTAYGFVLKYMEKTGNKLRKAEINRLALGCSGVKRTTGQHPGGLMIVPNDMDIHDFTAVQHPPGKDGVDTITTHFTYTAIHDNLLKLDLLGHDDPTILRHLQVLTGLDVRKVPLDDPETMGLFTGTETLGLKPEDIDSETGTFGVPEFGTTFTRGMLMDAKPKYISDLIRLSGFSHGTDVWAGNARELIVNQNVPLSEAISTRDSILLYLTAKGLANKTAFQIMEAVRKGKGLKPEEEEIMREHHVPEWYINSCRKIQYLFPKAHAAAYVLSGFRIAWFKMHRPAAFYAAYFTVRAAGTYDADLVSKGINAVRGEIVNIKRKGNEATANEKSMQTHLELTLEAMCRGIKFEKVDLYRSDATEWLILDEATLLPPLSALQGIGANAAAAIVAARAEGEFTSVEDLAVRGRANKTVIETLRLHGCLGQLSETDQLTLF
ncbi:MAG: PolC-type DNA polymerase III [Negativicutes bacterium]|nr:PolC-type DNA polymerase III [Negativicutes bacterium]